MSSETENRLRGMMATQGERAFERGLSLGANPYLPGNPLRTSWDGGWLAAQQGAQNDGPGSR